MTTIFSSINAGMCNQFLTHYVTKLLCLKHGYSYKCGINFVANGFPQLTTQHVSLPKDALMLNKPAIRQISTLYEYPFHSERTYILSGMLGAMEDGYFPGVTKRPVYRQFPFNDLKDEITQYQFQFTNTDILNEFKPGPILSQQVHSYMRPFQDELLIGIHRRRTDYASWNQGIYMDTDEQIFEKIKFFRSICGTRKPKFVLCSDDPSSVSFLLEEPDVYLVNAEKEIEWLILQQTHFLIGAVSTFTFTAAGFNSIPYVFANEVINSDFRGRIQADLAKIL